jgi:hypothetical protein
MTNNHRQKRRPMLQDIWPEVTEHVNKEYQLSLTVDAARKRYYRGDLRVARAYKDAVLARKKNAEEFLKIQSEIKAIVNHKPIES